MSAPTPDEHARKALRALARRATAGMSIKATHTEVVDVAAEAIADTRIGEVLEAAETGRREEALRSARERARALGLDVAPDATAHDLLIALLFDRDHSDLDEVDGALDDLGLAVIAL